MSGTPTYNKPPVREALIDIQIDPVSSDNLKSLEELHKKLIGEYPNKKIRHKYAGTISVQQGGEVVTTPKVIGPIGYLFQSNDQKRLIQVRLDGFTFYRLKPDPQERWVGWPAMREEAKKAWELYAQALNLREITRLAVRYINQIVIPQPSIELNHYLTVAPQIPPGLPYQDFGHFFSRIVIPIPDLNATAILIQAPGQEKFPNCLVLTLDIDVFKRERISLDRLEIWGILDRLRELKNMIFEASLHQKTKELFQ